MKSMTAVAVDLVENGLVPDPLVRFGIRRLVTNRLREMPGAQDQDRENMERAFVAQMNRSEIAPLAHKANEQHYEVPPQFFAAVLGAHRKYSCCYWDRANSLDQAEEAALDISCRRARIADHQDILELGCGWGSLTLYMAERFPASRITAVTNSVPQRDYIMSEAAARGLSNIQVLHADMNSFSIDRKFDRVVSIEMFEHMRNYKALFERISGWLTFDGLFFMHIFCHASNAYAFVDRDASDWMSRHFFSGGIMPSKSLPHHFQERLTLIDEWFWSGIHYQKTANAWLRNMEAHRADIMAVLERTYGPGSARLWWTRWRIFFMACAELFGFDSGRQWQVGHYLFANRIRN